MDAHPSRPLPLLFGMLLDGHRKRGRTVLDPWKERGVRVDAVQRALAVGRVVVQALVVVAVGGCREVRHAGRLGDDGRLARARHGR